MSGTEADSSIDPMPEIGSLWRVPNTAECVEGTILQLDEILEYYTETEDDANTLSCRFFVLFGSVPDHWARDGSVYLTIGLTPEARSYLLFNLEKIKED